MTAQSSHSRESHDISRHLCFYSDVLQSYLYFFFLMIRRPPRSTLSLHDALPICIARRHFGNAWVSRTIASGAQTRRTERSEEHTSELQSPCNIVCRLLLEKKTTIPFPTPRSTNIAVL